MENFLQSAVKQLQRIGGNSVTNDNFLWDAPLSNTATGKRALAAKRLVNHVFDARNNMIQNGIISADEPITLIGYSHGGNVAIQAVDEISKQLGVDVNLITVSTPAYETEESLEQAGLSGLEDPNKKSSINEHIQIVHENDGVTSFWAQGEDTYETSNSEHPVTNYIIGEGDVNLKGYIKSHTDLPYHVDFPDYLKTIPTMSSP